MIGADCVVGHLAHLEGCTVGDRCLIGSNSVVLNRVVIGDGSLVGRRGAGAEGTVVPPDSRALGVPARVRDGAGTPRSSDYAVALYVENARRYRHIWFRSADLLPAVPCVRGGLPCAWS